MSNVDRALRSVPALLCFGIGIGLGGGCQHCVNPFADDLFGQSRPTTPSVEAARAKQVTVNETQRLFTQSVAETHSGAIFYNPLYFEDPYEHVPDGDRPFVWTLEDYWYGVYGPARFLASAVLFPVSAVVTPPWTWLRSDGSGK